MARLSNSSLAERHVNTTPHRAHFTHANIFSRVAQGPETAQHALFFCVFPKKSHSSFSCVMSHAQSSSSGHYQGRVLGTKRSNRSGVKRQIVRRRRHRKGHWPWWSMSCGASPWQDKSPPVLGVHVNQQTGAGAVSLGAGTVSKLWRLDLGSIGSGSDAGNALSTALSCEVSHRGSAKKLWLHFSCLHFTLPPMDRGDLLQ